jgi:hypothetical protein
MEVSGQLHALATSPPKKEPLVPIVYVQYDMKECMYISHCKGRNWLLIFVIWIANKLLVAVEV